MSLADFLSQPSGGFDVVPGYAGVYPLVQVGGLSQPAIWLGDYALPGESIIVGIIRKPDAPAQCLMLGRVGGPLPTEAIVTAAPGGSDTITVTADSVDYTVTFLESYTPTVSDRVGLIWQGGTGRVLGKVGVTPGVDIPVPPTAPPPGAASSGVKDVVASDSATYSVGYGWNTYYGQQVHQGDGSPWGGPADNRGSWFYSSGAAQLIGATITDVKFRLPLRTSAGASGAGTVHIYLHTSPTRPGGDVTRTAGPVDVSSTSAGNYVTLPASWGATLVAGGGISITGNPYMGFQGRGLDPASGQIKLTWQR